jgi:hypothetical protein
MPQTYISVFDNTNLKAMSKKMQEALKTGITKATDSGVEWIKEEIFNSQKFVGSKYYPNVKPATKKQKAKKGCEKVGIQVGKYRDSFDAHYNADGTIGTIRGGGGKINGSDYSKFQARWRVDKLFEEHRMKKTQEIVMREIENAL